MRDHTQAGELLPVPAHAQHRTVSRRQFKTNADRLRRRRMQRKGETAEQAAAAIPDAVERRPDLPFVQLRSSSTGQPFCLCVEHGPLQLQPAAGAFNAYGLGHQQPCPGFKSVCPFLRGLEQGLKIKHYGTLQELGCSGSDGECSLKIKWLGG